MHAWAALKPADIVQAARALREIVTGDKADGETEAAAPADASADERVLTRESAAAE